MALSEQVGAVFCSSLTAAGRVFASPIEQSNVAYFAHSRSWNHFCDESASASTENWRSRRVYFGCGVGLLCSRLYDWHQGGPCGQLGARYDVYGENRRLEGTARFTDGPAHWDGILQYLVGQVLLVAIASMGW